MASFKFEIYSNIQVYGSVEVEADSFQEAAKKFAEQSKSNLCEIDWEERSYDYDSGAMVDRITCDDYKLSPDSGELDEEVLVEMPGGGVPIGEFKLADVLDLVQQADASLLNQQLEQDTASVTAPDATVRKGSRL